MILASLKSIAMREGLVANPDYEPRPVSWIIQLDKKGLYLGLISTLSEQGPKKKLAPKIMNIPRRSGRTSGAIPDFLVDKSEYVLGMEPDGKRKPEDLEHRQALFAEFIRTAANHLKSEELIAVSRFLDSKVERSRCSEELNNYQYASNDLFAFEVEGRLVHDAPPIQEYFSGLRQLQTDPVRQCLVCGEFRSPVQKHPSIKLRGGSSSGVALVSFNSDAFESYGWSRNENAAVCRACADAYTAALSRMLSDRYPDPKNPGATLGRRYVSISSDTTAIYWAEQESETLDLIGGLLDAPDPNSVQDVLASPHKGRESGGDVNPFYCLILSGGQGRAILRSIHRGTMQEIETSIKIYFRRLVNFVKGPMPLFLLMRSLAVQGKVENLAPNLASEIFLAILFGRPFPRALLSSALQRCRAEQNVSRARAALIGLYLTANLRKEGIEMGLNKELSDAGYHLGRLLAVLERLQGDAVRTNMTLAERYYGAASTRPGTVFPSLLKLAQHHAAKAQAGRFFQSQLAEVLGRVVAFPATLNLDEQGMFAIGYYHQREEYFRSKDSGPAAGDNSKAKEGEN